MLGQAEALPHPLASPRIYSLVQRALGAERVRRHLLAEHLRPAPGERILDLGCGPADVVALLPAGTRYTGVDANAAYVAAARKRYAARTEELIHADLRELDLPRSSFDAVLGIGILHHLDDDDARSAIRLSASALAPGGRLVTADPAIDPAQPRLARWLAERDRGTWLRGPVALEQLASAWFERVELEIRHDLARLPYTHAIVVARRPRPGA